ncbi:unnamed protein product [Boreogadus saida]
MTTNGLSLLLGGYTGPLEVSEILQWTESSCGVDGYDELQSPSCYCLTPGTQRTRRCGVRPGWCWEAVGPPVHTEGSGIGVFYAVGHLSVMQGGRLSLKAPSGPPHLDTTPVSGSS